MYIYVPGSAENCLTVCTYNIAVMRRCRPPAKSHQGPSTPLAYKFGIQVPCFITMSSRRPSKDQHANGIPVFCMQCMWHGRACRKSAPAPVKERGRCSSDKNLCRILSMILWSLAVCIVESSWPRVDRHISTRLLGLGLSKPRGMPLSDLPFVQATAEG